jgi:DNA-3-methyladenine glycosylase II
MTNEEIIEELIKVKGIGVWTAEMFLMFTLCRTDVFSCGDLGLQNAIKKAYGLEKKPTKQELLELSAKWSPYRTIASRLLWKSLVV